MIDRESLDIKKLEDSSNNSQWKFELRIALKNKGLFGYVDETEAKPNDDKITELMNYNKLPSQAEIIIFC